MRSDRAVLASGAIIVALTAVIMGGSLVLIWVLGDVRLATHIMSLFTGPAAIVLGVIGPQRLRRWLHIAEPAQPPISRQLFSAGWRLMVILIGIDRLIYVSDIQVLPKDLQATLVFAFSILGLLFAAGLIITSEVIARRKPHPQ